MLNIKRYSRETFSECWCVFLGFNHNSFCYKVQTVTLIPGDGIGPEISDSVKQIFAASGVSPCTDTVSYVTAKSNTNCIVSADKYLNLDQAYQWQKS